MVILRPIWCGFALALAPPLALAILWYGSRRRRRVLAEWLPGPGGTTADTDVSPRKRACRNGLFVLALLLICLALGRPSLPEAYGPGAVAGDLVLLIDCSRSMQAGDLEPSRFRAAIRCAATLVRETPAQRLGLVAFAGEAFTECPLTRDRDAILQFLDRLDCETIPLPGTDLRRAFDECARLLKSPTKTPTALILFTDGEDVSEGNARPQVPDGTSLLIVGLGDASKPSPIPTPKGPLLDPGTGQPVASQPDFASLQTLATRSDGTFLAMSDTPEQTAEQAQAWLRDRLAGVPALHEAGLGPYELYPWLACAALLCLLSRWSLGERRPRRTALLLVALAAIPAQAAPDGDYQRALALLDTRRASEAVIAWKQVLRAPNLPANVLAAAKLNLGVAHHQLGRQLILTSGTQARATIEFTRAEACYAACLWDEAQRPRATRNLARLVHDRKALEPPESGKTGEPKQSAAPPPPDPPAPEPGTGQGNSPSASDGGEGAPDTTTGKPGETRALSQEEAAKIAEEMRRNEGDFNEALRQKRARTWRTTPPKRPW